MNVKPNPRYEVFLSELGKTNRRFSEWHGIAFRATPLEFGRATKLLDGMGALKFGGRWSAAGTLRAVNLSLTQETAIRESAANFTYYNFAQSNVKPKVLVGVRLKLEKVIDLASSNTIGDLLWIKLDELLAEDWRNLNDAGHESQSQAFGRAAHDLGAEAIIAPSARVAQGVNLVHFPESLTDSSEVEILGKNELNRWLKK